MCHNLSFKIVLAAVAYNGAFQVCKNTIPTFASEVSGCKKYMKYSTHYLQMFPVNIGVAFRGYKQLPAVFNICSELEYWRLRKSSRQRTHKLSNKVQNDFFITLINIYYLYVLVDVPYQACNVQHSINFKVIYQHNGLWKRNVTIR